MSADPAETFRQEAQDLLEQLEQALLDLDQMPGNMELIDSAFRALHTIKGSGAMFGFEKVAAFTHHVENAFDEVRKGRIAATPELIALALAAKDHIRGLLEGTATAGTPEEAAILAGLQQILEHVGAAGAAAMPAAMQEEEAPGAWQISIRLPRDAMAMGTNPLLLLDELREMGTATVVARTQDIPPLEDLQPSDCHIAWEVVLHTDRPRAAIEEVFLFVLDDMTLELKPLRETPPAAAQPEAPPASPPAPTAAEPAPRQAAEPPPRREDAKNTYSIRVPAERLDELMDRVGELVIAQSRLRQVAAASTDMQLRSVAEELERLALELRDTTMGMRTVPIAQLFNRFRRLVHDTARELGKDIELVTTGEETELDKTMIERLADPLVHMIRNSLDHGLETPEGRTAAGKPRAGRLHLSARHAGAQVQISIRDDGRGLDQARIRARAEERGLIVPGQKLTEGELFQLIFEPGFSTAQQVTSLSGRGVGMDVVRRTIEGLRGSIDITSTLGQGTEITLCLPLTLAIIDGLLVRVGQGRYVIPLSAVEECVELSAEAEHRQDRCNFLNIRGRLVPFLRLREVFASAPATELFPKAVIVSSGEQHVGLVVDQVIGDHQTVIKSLSKLHADATMFSGATILGDGSVALILDIAQLVAFGQAHEAGLLSAA
ncbi:chemotaxis protein CheA [Paracraurococcus lichenis]|uniref:Chemotaxis protein CheA n=1 Tax=Paracraurococcus lichenis TaxID=3064888 RepID=A0ABT9E429_9PROT|nr:chemotaxis protein CheA [Paracraurococcus sp. LOR1-02]MDO9710931.1 chemotaxis protein CheA [Paracraurococcus sp. LOR1-02]